MKKICFISLNPVSPWGGSEDLWYETAVQLAEKNYCVSAIFYDWKQRESKYIVDLEKANISVFKIPFIKSMRLRIRRYLNPVLGDMLIQNVERAYRKIKPDIVVITTTAPTGAELMIHLQKEKIPYLLNIQLADECLWHRTDEVATDCYKNAKTVYFLADRNKISTEKQLGARLQNSKKLYNPIKTSDNIEELIIKNGVINFACVGRMGVEHKRQDLILEILSGDKWKNRNWNLYFFGKGEHEESLKRLTRLYSLEDRVFFKGHIENIDAIWQHCHCLLLPSAYESVPMAVTEAMKCGRIVVVTNVGFASEFVEDGINGFKSESATVNEYSQAMERAWQKINDWKPIAANAKTTINRVYPKDPAAYFAAEIINAL